MIVLKNEHAMTLEGKTIRTNLTSGNKTEKTSAEAIQAEKLLIKM